jgi:hypothetical protein
LTRRPNLVGPRSVRLQAGQIVFVLCPADVGRKLVVEQHQPLGRRHHHPPSSPPPGLLFPPIHLTATVGIGARIDWVLEQVLQRHAARPPPD